MPQMKPMMWLFMFIISLLLSILMMSNFNFYKNYNTPIWQKSSVYFKKYLNKW